MKTLNNKGNVNLILMAVVAAVVLAISIVIVFSVLGGLDNTTVDANFGGVNETPAANATDDITANLETFYTISPIYVVVLAAVGIIAAIMMIVIKK